jgi:hypothetical protein
MEQSSLNINNLRPGNRYFITGRGSVYDVVAIIQDIARQSSKTEFVKEIADRFNGEDQLKKIFDYSYKNIVYRPDPEDEQNLRTLYNLFREREGNCTSYTTLISSILLAKGIPHYLRVVGYANPREFEHIYIVTKDGTVLDPVIGQKQDGSDTFNNRDGGHFNKEIPYLTKKDFPMKINILNGTNKIGCNCNNGNIGSYRRGRLGGYDESFCTNTKDIKQGVSVCCGPKPENLGPFNKAKRDRYNSCAASWQTNFNAYDSDRKKAEAEAKRLRDIEAAKKLLEQNNTNTNTGNGNSNSNTNTNTNTNKTNYIVPLAIAGALLLITMNR